MITPSYKTGIFIGLFLAGGLRAGAQERRHKEIPLGNEREISVIVDVSFGTVIIGPGPSEKLVVADFSSRREGESEDFKISYKSFGTRGELIVRSKDRSRFWGKDDESEDRVWTLQFSDRIPMDLRVELGAGKGDLDLSGLRIQSLRVSSGASSVELNCSTPNPIVAEEVIIESGVSKFTARNLANTNFRRLKFSGGVGAYRLDFSGKLIRDAEAKVEVGLGAITIDVPREMPVQLYYDDTWFSSFDLDDGFMKRRGGMYETVGFASGNPALSIRIEAGLGSVKIRRR
ncbi:MAG: hypothetical protein HBSIN02_18220 [Bacteroidia bacterium]|nr:MAG: hypothetical protein HBSIN02_18220 [Bacteroidia bacterium]